MAWDGLVQPTGKYCSIRHMEYPKFQTGIFGRMESALSFYQYKEYVWSFVRNFKDSGIGIANNFPREINKIHEKLYPVLKAAKKAKQKTYFKVDKLIVNG